MTNDIKSADAAQSGAARTLVRLGAVLFMVGLLTGLASGSLANPRMGLSAHLEGVMNGTFLIALGAVWRFVSLPAAAERWAVGLLVFGTVVNWLTTLAGAIWNTGRMTPIAAPSPAASDWQEAVIAAGLISLSLAMIGGMALVIWGLFRKAPA